MTSDIGTSALIDTEESYGLELAGYHDLDDRPGFKLAMQQHEGRWYLYLGHLWWSGWSVLDVTDPTDPQLLKTIPGPEHTWTLQVQAADGLLLTGLERPSPGWGMDPDSTAATGLYVWDVGDDPTSPRLLTHYQTTGRGTHRNFYAGGRFAYLAASPDGFQGNILVVLDLDDPSSPREVGRFWWPGQWVAGGETPEHDHYLHGSAYVVGDTAYLSYGRVGLVVLDVSDPTEPTLKSHLSFGDLGSFIGCHSAVPYGRDILVCNSEAIAEGADEQLNYTVTVDISDPVNPRVTGWFPIPKPSAVVAYRTYLDKGGRFGPHNQHQAQNQPHLAPNDDTVYLTYFNAGLRRYDISDPAFPIETGWFVPTDPVERRGPKPASLVTQFEDVLVDARGYVYCTDKNHGLTILRHTS